MHFLLLLTSNYLVEVQAIEYLKDISKIENVKKIRRMRILGARFFSNFCGGKNYTFSNRRELLGVLNKILERYALRLQSFNKQYRFLN